MNMPFLVVGLSLAWLLVLPSGAAWLSTVMFGFGFRESLTLILSLWVALHAIVCMVYVVRAWIREDRDRIRRARQRALGK
jgi:thiol:disulfide interchange protein